MSFKKRGAIMLGLLNVLWGCRCNENPVFSSMTGMHTTIVVHAMLISDASRQIILINQANHPERDESLQPVNGVQVCINGVAFQQIDHSDHAELYNYYCDSLQITPGQKCQLLIIVDHDTIRGTTDVPEPSELSSEGERVCWTDSPGGCWYAVECIWEGEEYFSFNDNRPKAGCKDVPQDDPDLQWGWFNTMVGVFDRNYYLYTSADQVKAGLVGNAVGLFGSVTVSRQRIFLHPD